MVPPGSDRVPPAPPYSGSSLGWPSFRIPGFHGLRPPFPGRSPNWSSPIIAVLQPRTRLNAHGLGFSAFARRYSRNHCCFLLLRVLRCFSSPGWPHFVVACLPHAGFPHSGTRGSTAICASPRLFAACHALLRLREPRHPPYALS